MPSDGIRLSCGRANVRAIVIARASSMMVSWKTRLKKHIFIATVGCQFNFDCGFFFGYLSVDLNSSALELLSTNVTTCFISTPIAPYRSLAIKMPFITIILKNLEKSFTFEIEIRDHEVLIFCCCFFPLAHKFSSLITPFFLHLLGWKRMVRVCVLFSWSTCIEPIASLSGINFSTADSYQCVHHTDAIAVGSGLE